MEFTGERVIPGEVDPDLWNEHLSRYAFAARFAQLLLSDRRAAPNGSVQTTEVPGATAAGGSPDSAGLRVLDAGCGSGYGTAHLASLGPTLQVVGIDHSEEALAYARAHYAEPNLRFAHGDCLALEFPDGEFDLVVAFEVLEHLSEPTKFLEQARRMLCPSGHLLVSTPNRRYYSEERGYVNPFHTREYDASEFDALLAGFFPERVVFAQNHAPAIAFFPCGMQQSSTDGSGGAARFGAPSQAADQPHFLVAVCARQPGTVPEPFVFVPSAGNVLRERELHLRTLEEESKRELDERKQWAERLNAELQEARQQLEARQQELEERTHRLGAFAGIGSGKGSRGAKQVAARIRGTHRLGAFAGIGSGKGSRGAKQVAARIRGTHRLGAFAGIGSGKGSRGAKQVAARIRGTHRLGSETRC